MQRTSSKRSRARPEGTLAPYGQHVDGTGGSTPCPALVNDASAATTATITNDCAIKPSTIASAFSKSATRGPLAQTFHVHNGTFHHVLFNALGVSTALWLS